MNYLNRWLLLAGLLLLPLSAQAKNDDDGGQEKVCFCHNINHNPHTICTADPGLINGHMAHVNGEVPGVQDSLGVCESEPDPSAGPGDDDGDDGEVDHDPPGDDDGEADEDHPGDDNTGGDGEAETPPKDQGAPGPGEGSDAGNGTTGNRGLSSMEGSGCSLNAAAAGAPGGALPWALLATLPLLWTRRR